MEYVYQLNVESLPSPTFQTLTSSFALTRLEEGVVNHISYNIQIYQPDELMQPDLLGK